MSPTNFNIFIYGKTVGGSGRFAGQQEKEKKNQEREIT